MTVENELKYILDDTGSGLFEEAAAIGEHHRIMQGYIDGSYALKQDEFVFVSGDANVFAPISPEDYTALLGELGTNGTGSARLRQSSGPAGIEHFFTFKQFCGNRLIEIERSISKSYFARMWEHAADIVIKDRFKAEGVQGVHWDIDFLQDDAGVYVALAEAEMPEHMDEPPELLDLVKRHLLYRVGRNDTRFTNKRLAHPGYARGLLAEIRQKCRQTA